MQTGLVLELQRLSMDHESDTLDLLSHAYVVARKLRIESFIDWLEQEQKGYRSRKTVPRYRKVATYLHYRNPINGWQPAILQSKEDRLLYSSFPVTDSISSICDLLKNNEPFSYFFLSDELNIKCELPEKVNLKAQ